MSPEARLVRAARVKMRETDVATRPDGSVEMDPAANPLRRVLEGVAARIVEGGSKSIRDALAMLKAVLS